MTPRRALPVLFAVAALAGGAYSVGAQQGAYYGSVADTRAALVRAQAQARAAAGRASRLEVEAAGVRASADKTAREAAVWAYFNNDWEGFAVRNALDLRSMLTSGGTPVGPRA